MFALISDIHSNIEALQAVMEDMAAFPVTEIYCLGDVIGYGPNPRECLDIVRARCAFTLMGNHEDGLLRVAEDFNLRARRALDWTRDMLNPPACPREQSHVLWEQIDGFEVTHRTDDGLFVHGSPRDPIREYVMPSDASNATMMEEIFHLVDRRTCFAGHTHMPGIFTLKHGFVHQARFAAVVKLPAKSFVNIGSVGQPRDGDNRASYVIVDGDELQFRRVAYDFAKTMEKIRAVPQLDDFLADRLKLGK